MESEIEKKINAITLTSILLNWGNASKLNSVSIFSYVQGMLHVLILEAIRSGDRALEDELQMLSQVTYFRQALCMNESKAI